MQTTTYTFQTFDVPGAGSTFAYGINDSHGNQRLRWFLLPNHVQAGWQNHLPGGKLGISPVVRVFQTEAQIPVNSGFVQSSRHNVSLGNAKTRPPAAPTNPIRSITERPSLFRHPLPATPSAFLGDAPGMTVCPCLHWNNRLRAFWPEPLSIFGSLSLTMLIAISLTLGISSSLSFRQH